MYYIYDNALTVEITGSSSPKLKELDVACSNDQQTTKYYKSQSLIGYDVIGNCYV